MRRKRPSISTQIPLFPLAAAERPIELATPQQQELISALAELLRHAANASGMATGGNADER
jgi:hypothetical protein